MRNLYDMAEVFGVKITELFPPEDQFNKNVHPSEFKIQTICPSCGAKISASVTADG